MSGRAGDGQDPRAGWLKLFDKNSDGKIGKDEAVGRLKENFDALDLNKDGQIEPQELREAWQRRRAAGSPSDGKPGEKKEEKKPEPKK